MLQCLLSICQCSSRYVMPCLRPCQKQLKRCPGQSKQRTQLQPEPVQASACLLSCSCSQLLINPLVQNVSAYRYSSRCVPAKPSSLSGQSKQHGLSSPSATQCHPCQCKSQNWLVSQHLTSLLTQLLPCHKSLQPTRVYRKLLCLLSCHMPGSAHSLCSRTAH